jgi:hypothetical protein
MSACDKKVHLFSCFALWNHLTELTELTHADQLFKMISESKILLIINCWISTSKHAFLEITEYFIDKNWRYQKILLDFESIFECHDDAKLAELIIQIVWRNNLSEKILAVTTDNAENNNTIMFSFKNALKNINLEVEIFDLSLLSILFTQYHISCLAHVIQLFLKIFLSNLCLSSTNDEVTATWNSETDTLLQANADVSLTLKKICFLDNLTWIRCSLIYNLNRFEKLSSLSIQVLNSISFFEIYRLIVLNILNFLFKIAIYDEIQHISC